jgi:fructoselysine-6-P-deglycase FrlB-like protein
MGGDLFLAEIREQPEAIRRLLDHEAEFASAATILARHAPAPVRLVGHGSSDNAAAYGVYVFGLLPGWTALRDSISLAVYYGADIDLAGPWSSRSRSRGARPTSSSTRRGRAGAAP